jgi:uncharacterized protein YhbP (UPF0306 family)
MALKLPPQVDEFIAGHHVMTLATQGVDGPWAAALFYVRDGDDLIFLSSPASRHCRNLVATPLCAATIQPETVNWRDIQGVQIEGEARELPLGELANARQRYGERFPFVRPSTAPPAIVTALSKVRWYRLRMVKLYFIDNARGFGLREEFAASGGKL